ncbi:MAG: undecaprenyl-phosphate glucose phosphotransferase [Prevotella sp.]
MENVYRRFTNGSRIIYLTVAAFDIVLANIVLYALVNCGLIRIPPMLVGDDAAGVFVATVASLVSILFYGNLIYRQRVSVVEVVTRSFKLAVFQSMALMVVARLMSDTSEGIISVTAYYFATYYILLLVVRFCERQMLNHLRRMGHNRRSVIFVGTDIDQHMHLYRDMAENAAMAYHFLGYYSDTKLPQDIEGLKFLGTQRKLCEEIENGNTPFYADEVFYFMKTSEEQESVVSLVKYCDKHIIQLFLLPEFFSYLSFTFSPVNYGGLTLFTSHNNNIGRLDSRIIKRLFDILFSLVVCVFMLPFVPVIWLIIKVQSPGPVFFKQKRTGLNGKEFMLYKFRSMHVNPDADRLQATKDDPRKFPFGEFMRKTNIDELPQFFNVLRGDMSIVGPRPHMVYHTEMYSNLIEKYMVRHFSKPGITGWAQVTGFRGETRELWQMEERVKRDIWYNENWSFLLDLEIIARTAIQIIFPNKNAY